MRVFPVLLFFFWALQFSLHSVILAAESTPDSSAGHQTKSASDPVARPAEVTGTYRKNPNTSIMGINFRVQIEPGDNEILSEAQKVMDDVELIFKNPAFANFLKTQAPLLTEIIIDPSKLPHSSPPTINGKYKSLTELMAIIIHEGYAHGVVADSGRDSELIDGFKKAFPNLNNSRLSSRYPEALAETIGYRHVGVNAIEAMVMQQILSSADFNNYYKPQNLDAPNPLRSGVYEEIYNLVIAPALQDGAANNLIRIQEILRKNGALPRALDPSLKKNKLSIERLLQKKGRE